MFIPYRPRIKNTRFPVFTLVVAVVCLLVYWAQDRNEKKIFESAENFCTEEIAQALERGQRTYIQSQWKCPVILTHIYLAGEKHLAWHKEKITAAGDPESANVLETHYRAFAAQAPRFLTARLWHRHGSWNPLELLSSVISHGSWDHVIGNLFFFIAFGVVVETVIGPVLFLMVFLSMALGNGALENILRAGSEGLPSLGLSGVVSSVMTLAAYFAPTVRIKFFFFYFLFFGVISWPLWAVAGWYVFWDLWSNHFYGQFSNVNYVAHLCGAAFGLMLGITVFRHKRHWAQKHIVRDEPTLKDEESWLYKLNTYAATPVVMYFVVFYGAAAFIIGIYLFVTFIKSFAAQLLIAAPIVAGLYKIWRLKQMKPADRPRIDQGLQCLARHEFVQAEKILRPLAEGGHARAQHAMGMLFATATGAKKNDAEALKWFNAAAHRGWAEAQYQLGVRHYHGMGVVKDLPKAIEYLEQAASKGLGDAASTLAHLFENGPLGIADKEKAIEWYYKAGLAFYQSGRQDDARAMVQHLQSLIGKFPVVHQLVAELEKLFSAPPPASDKAHPHAEGAPSG